MVARSERLAGLPRWGGTRVRNIEISWSTMAVPLCAPAFSATRSEPLFLFCCLQHCCASTRSNHSFDFHNSVNLMLHKQVITHTHGDLYDPLTKTFIRVEMVTMSLTKPFRKINMREQPAPKSDLEIRGWIDCIGQSWSIMVNPSSWSSCMLLAFDLLLFSGLIIILQCKLSATTEAANGTPDTNHAA